MFKVLIAAVLCVSFSACSVTVPREEMSQANYGPKLSNSDALDIAKRYFGQLLLDPDSAKMNCSPTVRKGWARDNMFDKPTYGYLVLCDINAKNSFGGYTGYKNYVVVVNGSRAFSVEINRSDNQRRNPERWMGYSE